MSMDRFCKTNQTVVLIVILFNHAKKQTIDVLITKKINGSDSFFPGCGDILMDC